LGFEMFIAGRYLRSRRRENFISLISLISITGVALGVIALDCSLSMMNGFETEIRQRIVETTAHISVYTYAGEGFSDWRSLADKVQEVPEVIGVAPGIYAKSVIGSSQANEGVYVKGIIPEEEVKVSRLPQNIVAGRLSFEDPNDSLPGIVIGRELASTLGVKIKDEVIIASLKQKKLSITIQPKYKRFRVTGIFETGFNEYDATLVYIAMPIAQDLFKLDGLITDLQVKVTDVYRSREVAKRIEEHIGQPYYAVDWSERHKNLFSWMTLEKYGMTLILGLIVVVAAFGIVSTLVMLVLQKRQEIAILKSMGATQQQVMRIFVIQGTLLGIVGTVAGTCIGFLACWLQKEFHLVSIPSEIYFINTLPIDMRFHEFVLIAVSSVLISFLATLYPSRRASRLFPSDILRHG
jgi:lipoprotein-releasing system permease protein